MTTYTVDIYEPAGLTIVHSSTNVVDAGGTWRKNRVGRGFLIFPGQDEDLAEETTRGRICHVTTTRGAITLVVALFNIESRSFTVDDDGRELVRISGTGIEDRIGRHLITAEIHDGSGGPATDDITQIMTHQPGWSLSGTSNAGTQDGTWHSFREATVLQALQAAAEQSGEMWRLDSLATVKREIFWAPIPESSGSWDFTLYNDAEAFDDEASEGLIRSFDRGYDQSEVITRIYLYGSGTGDDRLTARAATWMAPIGFLFYPSASLLVNETLETQGFFNERPVHFSDIRLPSTRHEIVEKDASSDFITIRGDFTTLFAAGATFRVVDASDGNGVYTVDSSTYDDEEDLTTINVVEDLTGGSDDGFIEAATFELVEVDAANDAFVIRGDWTSRFVATYEFDVEGGPAAGRYTVDSSSYDGDDDETTISVVEEITDGTDTGYIVLDGSIGVAAEVAAANALAAAGYVWLKDRTGSERYHKIEAIYWRNARPGDRVRIVYSRGRVDLDEVHVVEEVSYRIGNQGERVMSIVTAPLGVFRSPPTEETVATKLMASLQDLLRNGTGSRVAGGTTVPSMEAHLSAQDPHPGYLLADGGRQLIGNLPVASGVQIDGVDISAHANDGDIHVDHTAVTLSAGDGLSGGGDISASRSFAVDGTVVRTSRTLTAGNGLTGGGDLSANRAFNLQTPGTVSAQSSNSAVGNHTHAVTASSNPGENERLLKSNASGWLQLERLGLGVSPDHPLHVSGDSFFDGSVGVGVEAPDAVLHSIDDAGAQLRLGYDAENYSDFTVAATGTLTVAPTNNLRLQPAGDIVLDPDGLDVLPGEGYEVNLGQLSNKYLTLHAAELWVETLVAQDTMATIGGRILVGPTTTLIADLSDSATTIDVEHNQMSNGDIAYLEADGKVEFIAIDSAPSSISGGYRYTVTRNLDGSGADEWFAGDALFNTGQSGDGFIDLYSFAGVTSGTSGPTIVGNVRASSTYNDWVEHWAIGNLNGLYDYGTDTYGVAFGGYGEANYLTIDPINGIRFFDESDVLRAQLSSDTWTLGHTDTAHIELTPSKLSMLDDAGDEKIVLGDAGDSYFAGVMTIGADGEIRQGSGTLGTNFTGLRIWRDSNIGRIAGYNDDDLQWYADTDGRLYAGGGSIFLDSNGLSLDITDGYNANEAVTFYRSSTRVADLYANFIPDPVSTNELYLMLQDPGGSDEPYLYMYSDGFAAGGSITLHSDQMTMDGFTQVV
ncbi:MAG: hypothetical protein ACOC9X_01270, partial [bacterium]